MFIKLTDREGLTVVANLHYVLDIDHTIPGPDNLAEEPYSTIYYNTGNKTYVKETPDAIWEKMKYDFIASPLRLHE